MIFDIVNMVSITDRCETEYGEKASKRSDQDWPISEPVGGIESASRPAVAGVVLTPATFVPRKSSRADDDDVDEMSDDGSGDTDKDDEEDDQPELTIQGVRSGVVHDNVLDFLNECRQYCSIDLQKVQKDLSK